MELPVVATVVGLLAMDLQNVHFNVVANSPRVRLACDRQRAATDVSNKSNR